MSASHAPAITHLQAQHAASVADEQVFEGLVEVTQTTLDKYTRALGEAQRRSRDLHHSMTTLRDAR